MLLLETIRFENGRYHNLDGHQRRMNFSRKALFGCVDKIDLAGSLQESAPIQELNKLSSKTSLHESKGAATLQKVRIIYSETIMRIEYENYTIPAIKSLKVVADNTIDYAYKYLDRTRLDELFAKRQSCDDILIVRNELVTDTWFANILFYTGTEWITPAKPLLKGTQREYLLNEKIVRAEEIAISDFRSFSKARLVNAMIRFEDELDIDMASVYH